MTNLLILDTETTGFDPKTDNVIEIAAALYSVEDRCVIQQVSTLIPCETNAASHVNRISPLASQVLQDVWIADWHPSSHILEHIVLLSQCCDYAIAHNADFDKSFLDERLNIRFEIPWIDSQLILFPNRIKGKGTLIDLCLAHDVPVASAHRALTDVQLLASLLSKQNDLEELIRQASLPRFLYVANVDYDHKHLAQDAGFAWNAKKAPPKTWSKMMTEEEAGKLGFRVVKT